MTKSKRFILAASLAALPSMSHAGGFDLTGQPIGIIFQEGNYIEGQVGFLSANVEGTNPIFGDFGDTADDFAFFSGGVKVDLTDSLSGALIFDTPFKRETTYEGGLFVGTAAEVEANSLTAVARYKFGDNFSIYGGPRAQVAAIDLQGPFARNPVTQVPTALPVYQIDVESLAFGFVAGVAAEIPDLKVRAALTYNSAITHDFDATEISATPLGLRVIDSSFETEVPQSINLDLQAPVSPSTLVRANIRWVDWGGVNFTPPDFLLTQGRPVVEYTEDTITYRLTVAQRINENFAAFVTGSYEADGGEEISLFKSVDGGFSLGGGFVYENEEGFNLQIGGEYRWLFGTSGPQVPTLPGTNTPTPATQFDDATAIGLSMKVGYRF